MNSFRKHEQPINVVRSPPSSHPLSTGAADHPRRTEGSATAGSPLIVRAILSVFLVAGHFYENIDRVLRPNGAGVSASRLKRRRKMSHAAGLRLALHPETEKERLECLQASRCSGFAMSDERTNNLVPSVVSVSRFLRVYGSRNRSQTIMILCKALSDGSPLNCQF